MTCISELLFIKVKLRRIAFVSVEAKWRHKADDIVTESNGTGICCKGFSGLMSSI